MRILIFTDNHFCTNFSLVNGRGKVFSKRLENQIETLNWVEKISKEKQCDQVICLGDFFDKSTIKDEEITALNTIMWNDIPHYFLVGNHESSVNGLEFNSTNALETMKNHIVVNSPQIIKYCNGDLELCFLPYIVERDRKPLKEYFGEFDKTKTRIILSHNDVKGVAMLRDGFEVSDIEKNCTLFLNGHIHNYMKFGSNGYNVGTVTGKDFGEDATKYPHGVMIITYDENTKQIISNEFIENPFALNFYKIDINTSNDLKSLLKLKSNPIMTLSCKEGLVEECREFVESNLKDAIYKVVIVKDENFTQSTLDSKELSQLDHIELFEVKCKEVIDNNDILEEELSEICK